MKFINLCLLLFLLVERRRRLDDGLRSATLPNLLFFMMVHAHIVMFSAHEINELPIKSTIVVGYSGSRSGRGCRTLWSVMVRQPSSEIEIRLMVLLLLDVRGGIGVLDLRFLQLLHHHHHLLLLRAWIVCRNASVQKLGMFLSLWRMWRLWMSCQVNIALVWLREWRVRDLSLLLRIWTVLRLRRWRRRCHGVKVLESAILWLSSSLTLIERIPFLMLLLLLRLRH